MRLRKCALNVQLLTKLSHVTRGATLIIGTLNPRISRPPHNVWHKQQTLRWMNVKSAHPPAPSRLRGRGQAGERLLFAMSRHECLSSTVSAPVSQWTFILFGGEQVLRSGAKSQRIAVWRLLYHLQHSGQYLSRLQTDWLTHDVASVSYFDSGIPLMAILAKRAERSTARA